MPAFPEKEIVYGAHRLIISAFEKTFQEDSCRGGIDMKSIHELSVGEPARSGIVRSGNRDTVVPGKIFQIIFNLENK